MTGCVRLCLLWNRPWNNWCIWPRISVVIKIVTFRNRRCALPEALYCTIFDFSIDFSICSNSTQNRTPNALALSMSKGSLALTVLLGITYTK